MLTSRATRHHRCDRTLRRRRRRTTTDHVRRPPSASLADKTPVSRRARGRGCGGSAEDDHHDDEPAMRSTTTTTTAAPAALPADRSQTEGYFDPPLHTSGVYTLSGTGPTEVSVLWSVPVYLTMTLTCPGGSQTVGGTTAMECVGARDQWLPGHGERALLRVDLADLHRRPLGRPMAERAPEPLAETRRRRRRAHSPPHSWSLPPCPRCSPSPSATRSREGWGTTGLPWPGTRCAC